MKPKKWRVKPACCPECLHILDGATMMDGEKDAVPVEGDYSVCVYCATPLKFTSDLSLRRLTPEEQEGMSDTLAMVIELCKASIREKDKGGK